MKILLTGSQGNLATALQNQLPQHDWVLVDRSNWPTLVSLKPVKLNLILHTAADLLTDVAEDPKAVLEANLMNTVRLLEFAETHKVPRFMFVSSCAVYGHSRSTAETVACSPVSINGMIKLLNESLIHEFCQRRGIKNECLRVFNTYGGRDRFSIISRLRRALNENQIFAMNNEGKSQRDFIHVIDVAKIIGKLIDNPAPWPCLNIGTGTTVRIADLVAVAQEQDPKFKVKSSPKLEVEYSCADTSRLKQHLGALQFQDVLEYLRGSEFNARQRG